MSLKTAVLLMAHGGPDHLEDVEPFLQHIMKGRQPTAELVTEIRERYRLIGGRSPLRAITERQAGALADALSAQGHSMPVYVGMRHWHPFILDVLKKITSDGIQRLVAMTLAPHDSTMSVGAYFEALEKACRSTPSAPDVLPIRSFADHPFLLKAIAERVEQALDHIPKSDHPFLRVIFTAHSLPERILAEGDPYPRELKATVDGVLKRLPPIQWEFAYQSRGRTPEPWLGPEVESRIGPLAQSGCRALLIVPVGFVSDHIEVLYDIDILYQDLARRAGIRLWRTESLNDHPSLIAALSDRILQALGSSHA